MEKIIMLKTNELVSAPDNPFKITMDYQMEQLIESIASTGVLVPIIVRSTDDGYEIVSGHRKRYACEYLGITEIPAIVRELDRASAIITLVDSNLQRENILPSEKAFAYKLKMEALSHQGTSCQVGTKLRSDEAIAEKTNDSARQVQRYIRLTNLIPELLQMVDEGRIAFTPAVELSYLTESEQEAVLKEIIYSESTPNLSQAQRLRGLCKSGCFNSYTVRDIISEEKANQKEKIKIPADKIKKYFPNNYTNGQIEKMIIKLCEAYYRKHIRDMSER